MLAPVALRSSLSLPVKTATFALRGRCTQNRVSRRRRSPTCEVQNTAAAADAQEHGQLSDLDLSLNEAVQVTLCRSQVMRQLGGRVVSTAPGNEFPGGDCWSVMSP